MDKYGVQVEEDVKTATTGECPWCGAKLDSGGACPKHGTEPFEKQRDTEKRDNK